MREELHPDSLSWTATHTAGNDEAFQMAMQLEDREVIDVNGQHVGHVTKCFVDRGKLKACQVTLDEHARNLFRAESQVLEFPLDVISQVDAEAVHLAKPGEQLVHPEDPRPLGAERDEGGADNKPRDVR